MSQVLGEGGRSWRLGQCPKFSRFLIWQPSLKRTCCFPKKTMTYNECHPFCFKITIFTEFSDLKITCYFDECFLASDEVPIILSKIFSNLIHAFRLRLIPFKFCTLSTKQSACSTQVQGVP